MLFLHNVNVLTLEKTKFMNSFEELIMRQGYLYRSKVTKLRIKNLLKKYDMCKWWELTHEQYTTT